MLADFFHFLWDTRIESDTVSCDGYEISNLISRDRERRRKGFLAARFVKPVVSVLVSFPFPVDIYAVNVDPQVGGQTTCGLEILAASLEAKSMDEKKKNVGIREDSKRPQQSQSSSKVVQMGCNNANPRRDISVFHSYQRYLNVDNVKNEFKNLFLQILRVQIPEGNVGHFVNSCFKHTVQISCDSRIVGSASKNVQRCALQHGSRLCGVSHLILRITQVYKGSVPCLGAVEVFGRPAWNTGTFVKDYARIIASRIQREKQDITVCCFGSAVEVNGGSPGHGTSLSNGTSPCISANQKPADLQQNGSTYLDNEIPDDFIDPITLNIMTLPVLLPSGTTIDHSTLERHIASEKSWGHPPSDPFTGLPLGTKVVPNAALKCRIDTFLLSSHVKVGNLGRTVGSQSECNSTTKLKMNSLELDKMLKRYGQKRTVCDEDQPLSKRHNSGVTQCKPGHNDSLDHALEKALCNRHQPDESNQQVLVSALLPACDAETNGGLHSQMLKQCYYFADLSILIHPVNMFVEEMEVPEENPQTFGSVDELLSRSKPVTGLRNGVDQTMNCCPHQEPNNVLFQLPCKHIICRSCLTLASVKHHCCPSCERKFDKKNVSRVHSVKV